MESLEKLIPFIFLIIWVIAAISRKKKRQPAPTPGREKKPAAANPFDKLQNTLKDLFAELEQPAAEELPTTLRPPETEFPEEGKTGKEKDIEITLSDKDTKPLPPKPLEIKPHYQTHIRKPIRTAVPIKKLREAVIWSEILAKPVSMRDE